MGSLNQVESSSSSKVSDRAKRRKIFKSRSKGLVTKFKELTTLCGCKSLFYLNSEFNRPGLVRMLPENPNEYQEIVKAYKNCDPKRGKGKKVLDSACMNDKPVDSNDQKLFNGINLSALSMEEIENIESNLEPVLDKISERIHHLTETNKEKSAEMGCNNEDGMMMMNGFLSVEPEFTDESALSTYYLGSEFESGEVSEIGCNIEDGMIMMNGFPSVEPEIGCNIEDGQIMMNGFPSVEPEIGCNTGEWFSLPAATDNEDGLMMMNGFPSVEPVFIDQSALSTEYLGNGFESGEPSAGNSCNHEDGLMMMNGFPSVQPEFIDQGTGEYDCSQDTGEWFSLTATTDDDILIDFDQMSSHAAGSLSLADISDMLMC